MMKIEEQIAVMTAFKGGRKVEYRPLDDPNSDWTFVPCPTWDFSAYEYREMHEDTRYLLDVTNIKQFFKDYIGDKVADANNVLREILSELTPNSLEFLTAWLADNTQCLENAGWIKQSDINASLIKEEFNDTYEEILQEGFDVDTLNDDQLREATTRWMNNSGYEDIVNMIKEEA